MSDEVSWGTPAQLKAPAHADEEATSALARHQTAQGALMSAQQQGDAALAQQAQAELLHAQQDYDRATAQPGLSTGKLTFIELRPPTIRGSTAVRGTAVGPFRVLGVWMCTC